MRRTSHIGVAVSVSWTLPELLVNVFTMFCLMIGNVFEVVTVCPFLLQFVSVIICGARAIVWDHREGRPVEISHGSITRVTRSLGNLGSSKCHFAVPF